MRKLIMISILALFSQTLWAEEVWVAASVYDGRSSGVIEYSGKMSRSDLDAVVLGAEEGAMFKLSEVFWLNDAGEPVRMSEQKKYGHIYGYTNTIYFKQSAVLRLVELDETTVNRWLKAGP